MPFVAYATMPKFPDEWAQWRVVLAHDWLVGMRGGERVLEILAEGFPSAPIVTLLARPDALSPRLRHRTIHTSFLQRWPRVHRYYRALLPLFPLAVERLQLPPADLVLSTSHCAIKAVRPPPSAAHVCYCFTPMRYVWSFRREYLGSIGQHVAAPLIHLLQRWDVATAARVDRFVTLSRHVRHRIWDFYERDATVVYPPADLDFFTPTHEAPTATPEPYDLVVAALVPYKRVDLAIRACNHLRRNLRVVGTGSEERRLRRLAGPTVQFLGRVDDPTLRELYRHCRCLIFPGEEDFGLAPVEAQACGRPVVAYGRGGATESVVNGVTGLWFSEPTEESLIETLQRFDRTPWDPVRIRRNAERFSIQSFVDGLHAVLRECMEERQRNECSRP